MIEDLHKIVNFIAVNFLLIFGTYSVLFFLARSFLKNKHELNAFDKSAIHLTIWIGTIWVVLKFVGILLFLYQVKIEDQTGVFSQHLSWLLKNSWFQLLFWVVLSQLLRIRFMKSNLLPRILIGFFFAFSFDRITMILANYHRDYVPRGQYTSIDFPEIIIGLILKTFIFILVIAVFHFGKRRIQNL